MHSHTTPLFDAIPEPAALPEVPESVTRRKARKRAFEKADLVFLDRYKSVLLSAGRVLGRFVAAEITAEYEKCHGAIAQHNARGLGGFYAQMQKQGVIRKTKTMRARKNGNFAAEYELVRR